MQFDSVFPPDLETGCCSSAHFTQMLHFPSDNVYLAFEQGGMGTVVGQEVIHVLFSFVQCMKTS